MLARYAARIRGLSLRAHRVLREELELDPSLRTSVTTQIARAGLCSADVVLVLLRRGMVQEAEEVAGVPLRSLRFEPNRIAGRPGRVVVPGDEPAAAPVHRGAAEWADERLARLQAANPRPAGTEAHRRYSTARVGMTRAQLLNRGVTRREQREWVRRGWADFR